MTFKIEDILEASIEYLVRKTDVQLAQFNLDKLVIILKLSEEDKSHMDENEQADLSKVPRMLQRFKDIVPFFLRKKRMPPAHK